jgi:hypothetical protein
MSSQADSEYTVPDGGQKAETCRKTLTRNMPIQKVVLTETNTISTN